jgi:hypothetical protein
LADWALIVDGKERRAAARSSGRTRVSKKLERWRCGVWGSIIIPILNKPDRGAATQDAQPAY